MGVVYEAQHSDTGQHVALKMARVTTQRLLNAIRTEIFALRKVRHPGIILILDEGVADGLPWFAMELLDGNTFAACLGPSSTLHASRTSPSTIGSPDDRSSQDQPEVGAQGGAPKRPRFQSWETLKTNIDIFRDVCAALAAAHRAGLVHRDLKPSNIFLKRGKEPILVDFGLSTFNNAMTARDSLGLQTRTRLAGTTAYLAPELIRGGTADSRSDLYALGCMLYEAATGQPPFVGSREQVLAGHQFYPVAPLRDLRPDVPREFEQLVERLLAKTSQNRPGYAEDVADVLSELGTRKQTAYMNSSPHGTPVHLHPPRLAGRQAMLSQIEGVLDDPRRQITKVVVVSGESGIGKTAFLMEVAQRAAHRRFSVVTGECNPPAHPFDRRSVGETGQHVRQLTDKPFYPLRTLFQFLADVCQERGKDFTDSVLGDRGPILAAYEPTLAFAPGQSSFPSPEATTPQAAADRVYRALIETLTRFCAHQSLVWLLDDLQWADSFSIKFLELLATEKIPIGNLVILVGCRTDDEPAVLSRFLCPASAALSLCLSRLSESAVADMVGDMLSVASAPQSIAQLILGASEGNPLFVTEYLRGACHDGLLRRDHGVWEWHPVTPGSIGDPDPQSPIKSLSTPSSIRELIEQRLRSLPEESLWLAEIAAVIGREIEVGLLVSLAQRPAEAIDRLLDDLRMRDIVDYDGPGRVRFRHDKVREELYLLIPIDRRRSYHGQVARWLDLSNGWTMDPASSYPRLARHLALGAQPTKAAHYFALAARNARDHHAVLDAIEFFQSALDSLEKIGDPDQIRGPQFQKSLSELYEERGDMLLLSGQFEPAGRSFQTGLPSDSQSMPNDVIARLERKIGDAFTARGLFREALSQFELAEKSLVVTSAESPEPFRAASERLRTSERIDIMLSKAWALYWMADVEGLNNLVVKIEPLVTKSGSPAQKANFFQASCLARLRNDRYRVSDETLSVIERAHRMSGDAPLSSGMATIQFIYAFSLLLSSRSRDAPAELEKAVVLAERTGDMLLKLRSMTYLTIARRTLGEIDPVRITAEATLKAAIQRDLWHYVGAMQACLGWVALNNRDMTTAESYLRDAMHSWSKAPSTYPFRYLAIAPLGVLLLLKQETSEAMEFSQSLLNDDQMRLPPDLSEALKSAVKGKDFVLLAGTLARVTVGIDGIKQCS